MVAALQDEYCCNGLIQARDATTATYDSVPNSLFSTKDALGNVPDIAAVTIHCRGFCYCPSVADASLAQILTF